MPNQTGPQSEAGKQASSQNNLKHGATSRSLFLSSENPADYLALLESAFEQYKPDSDHDAALVTRLIHDHWMLLRRERIVDDFESALLERKPDPTYWLPADLHEMQLLDRYKTEAARNHSRSLRNLQIMQKMNLDNQRWLHSLETQRQRTSIELERWQRIKVKEAAAAQQNQQDDLSEDDSTPLAPSGQRCVNQTIYIGYEDNIKTHYETTPTNEQLSHRLSESDHIYRVYNFIGGVPPEYKHLDGPGAYHCGPNTSLGETLTYQEWKERVAAE